MSQLGPISRGTLGAAQTLKLPLDLSGQCLTIMGMASGGVEDLGLLLSDPEGKEVAKDEKSHTGRFLGGLLARTKAS